jgi:hypothetical protein
MPSFPIRICLTSLGAVTIVITTSTCFASSAGDFATKAPSFFNSAVLEEVRLYTVTGKPALRMFFAIGLPIRPNPITPTFVFIRPLYQKIASKISIKDIADRFGLEPYGARKRHCPFHDDGTPSLDLSEDLGLFNCYGCKSGGNIIKFYAMLKQLNPNFKLEVPNENK